MGFEGRLVCFRSPVCAACSCSSRIPDAVVAVTQLVGMVLYLPTSQKHPCWHSVSCQAPGRGEAKGHHQFSRMGKQREEGERKKAVGEAEGPSAHQPVQAPGTSRDQISEALMSRRPSPSKHPGAHSNRTGSWHGISGKAQITHRASSSSVLQSVPESLLEPWEQAGGHFRPLPKALWLLPSHSPY